MKKFLQVIFLSLIFIPLSFCADNLVKPIKVTDAPGKAGLVDCPFGSAPMSITEKGKEIVGCYKCPKDTAPNTILKNGGLRCGKCPKGTILKKVKSGPNIIARGLEYECDCPNPNSYGVTQPDGSVKCTPAPKGKSATSERDIKEIPNGDKKFVFIGGVFTGK